VTFSSDSSSNISSRLYRALTNYSSTHLKRELVSESHQPIAESKPSKETRLLSSSHLSTTHLSHPQTNTQVMSSWISYLTGRGAATKDSTREAIVNLREHLLMLDKKEEYLGKKIDDELRKAKANATSNPRGKPFSYSLADSSTSRPRMRGNRSQRKLN